MNDDREGKREGLRAWHVALGVVGLLVVLIVLLVMAQKGSVERQLAALRAQGHPTSFAELAEQHQLPEGTVNAADVYMKAFDAFLKPADAANTPYIGQAKLPPRGKLLPEAVAQATAQCVADNQECLALLRQARTIEECRYDWDYGKSMPYLASMRHCAQLLASTIVLRGYEGDDAAVVACLRDELRLAQSLRHEPALISHLVRVACTALSLRALERTLSVTSFTDEQLVEMSQMLTEVDATLDLSQVLITERCFMIEYIRNPSLLSGTAGNTVPRIPGLGGIGLADILDYMTDCIEASRLPPAQRPARFRQIGDELADLSLLHVVVKTLAPALGRVAELDLRCRMDLVLARTVLAIERYRLATGTVPEDLNALVPAYLDQVPIDLQDGRPLRYQRADTGYRVYSVFEDGQDHGGKSREEVNRGDPHDWPFIVVK
jgi:hypothetical protein